MKNKVMRLFQLILSFFILLTVTQVHATSDFNVRCQSLGGTPYINKKITAIHDFIHSSGNVLGYHFESFDANDAQQALLTPYSRNNGNSDEYHYMHNLIYQAYQMHYPVSLCISSYGTFGVELEEHSL